jgi:hypothetical protein
MANQVTPLDVKRAEQALSKLRTTDPGYTAALKQYTSLSEQLDSQIAAVQQTQEAQNTAKQTAEQKKSQTSSNVANQTLLATITDLYQKSVDKGKPDPTYKAEIDKLNIALGNTPAPVSSTLPSAATGMQGTSNTLENFAAQTSKTTPAPTGTTPSKTVAAGKSTSKAKVPQVTVVTPEETKSKFLATYGVQAALVNSDPSLQKLFASAMAGTWDAKRFAAEFANTTWAKTHAETWQNAETARLSAPATYAQSYNNMRDAIARLAGTMGEIIPPEQLGGAADAAKTHDRTGNIVEWALDQSWGKGVNTDALRQHIAELGKINLSLPGGETGKAMTQLKSYATDMGMGNLALPGGNDYFAAAAQSIMLGKSDINTWQADILKNAKEKYKAFAPQFDAGQTLRTVAAPYINSLSNLLEIAPDQIDLGASTGYGKLISDAMNGSDPANPKPTALYDFEKAIKARPEWGFTNNARDTVMGGVHDLLKTFGKVS